jgi:hypothetical protein
MSSFYGDHYTIQDNLNVINGNDKCIKIKTNRNQANDNTNSIGELFYDFNNKVLTIDLGKTT